MGRKRSLQQIQELEYLNIGEVSTLTGVRQSTLKFYCEIEILPFTQAGPGLNRKFRREDVLKRIKEITDLKAKYFSIDDMIAYFKKKDATSKTSVSKKETVTA